MENDSILQENLVCRACLKLGARNSIFSTHKSTSLTYSHIFSSCTSVQVNPDDDLPKVICQKCLDYIVNFYIFKNEAIQNDLRLKLALNTEKLIEKGSIESTLPIVPHHIPSKIQSISKGNTVENELKNVCLENETIETTQYEDFEKGEDFQDDVKNSEEIKDFCKKVHQCSVCGKIVNSKSNLNQHFQKHTGERPHGCDLCGKKFRRAQHLVIHKRTHTGEKPHTCTICSKSFKQDGGLSAHMRIHSGESPYICSVCGKSFNHSSSLRYHKQTHSTETPYTCKVCQKSFKNSGYLKVHMRFHDDKRPFPCTMCDKKFFTSSHLNIHLKHHNNEVAHECIICGKGFVRSQHLKIHLATHTGEKAYTCKLCQKKFTQLSHLNRHMKIHSRVV